MSNVFDISGFHSPLKVSEEIPWDKIKKAIVIYENEDGTTGIHISSMTWRDRVWLTHQLEHQNFIDRSKHE